MFKKKLNNSLRTIKVADDDCSIVGIAESNCEIFEGSEVLNSKAKQEVKLLNKKRVNPEKQELLNSLMSDLQYKSSYALVFILLLL